MSTLKPGARKECRRVERGRMTDAAIFKAFCDSVSKGRTPAASQQDLLVASRPQMRNVMDHLRTAVYSNNNEYENTERCFIVHTMAIDAAVCWLLVEPQSMAEEGMRCNDKPPSCTAWLPRNALTIIQRGSKTLCNFTKTPALYGDDPSSESSEAEPTELNFEKGFLNTFIVRENGQDLMSFKIQPPPPLEGRTYLCQEASKSSWSPSSLLRQLVRKGCQVEEIRASFLQDSSLTLSDQHVNPLRSYVLNYIAWIRMLPRLTTAAMAFHASSATTRFIDHDENSFTFVDVLQSDHVAPYLAVDNATPRCSDVIRHTINTTKRTSGHQGDANLSDWFTASSQERVHTARIKIVHDANWVQHPELQHDQLARIGCGSSPSPVHIYAIAVGTTKAQHQAAKEFAAQLTTNDDMYPFEHNDPDSCLCRPFCFMSTYTPTNSKLGSMHFLTIFTNVRTTLRMDMMGSVMQHMLHSNRLRLLSNNAYYDWERRRWLTKHTFHGFLYAPRHLVVDDDGLMATQRHVSKRMVLPQRFIPRDPSSGTKRCSFTFRGPRSLCKDNQFPHIDLFVRVEQWRRSVLDATCLSSKILVELSGIGYSHIVRRLDVPIDLDSLMWGLLGSSSTPFVKMPTEVLTEAIAPYLSMWDAISTLTQLSRCCYAALGDVMQVLRYDMLGPNNLDLLCSAAGIPHAERPLPLDVCLRRLHPIELNRLCRMEGRMVSDPRIDNNEHAWEWFKDNVASREEMEQKFWPVRSWRAADVRPDYYGRIPSQFVMLPEPPQGDEPATYDTDTFCFHAAKNHDKKMEHRFITATISHWFRTKERFNILSSEPPARLGFDARTIGWSANVK